jgi:hypothetical protein
VSSPHLRTETHPIFETLFSSFQNTERWTKSKNPVILKSSIINVFSLSGLRYVTVLKTTVITDENVKSLSKRHHHHHHWQDSHFLIIAFLRRFSQMSLRSYGFHFFGFLNNNFFTEQGCQPCIQPPTWRSRSPTDRVAKLYPRAPGSLIVTFYDSQGYGGGILTHLHTGSKKMYKDQILKKFNTGRLGQTVQ